MSQALQLATCNLPLVQDGLQAYLQRVVQIPLLTEQEERELATRFHEEGNLQAAQKLVLSNLRFVVSIARGYMGYGLALADLIQEGTVGLMKAVKRFDPTQGVRLVAFAVHWIKSEIHEFVIRNWRIVKIATTKAQRKLFFNLRSKKKQLTWFSQDELDSVAHDLGVSPKDVMEMEARLNMSDTTFDAPAGDAESSGSAYMAAPEHYLIAPQANPLDTLADTSEGSYRQEKLQSALENLDDRSLDIVKNRYLSEEKSSLKALASKYNVSLERIRQIEKAAILSLRKMIAG